MSNRAQRDRQILPGPAWEGQGDHRTVATRGFEVQATWPLPASRICLRGLGQLFTAIQRIGGVETASGVLPLTGAVLAPWRASSPWAPYAPCAHGAGQRPLLQCALVAAQRCADPVLGFPRHRFSGDPPRPGAKRAGQLSGRLAIRRVGPGRGRGACPDRSPTSSSPACMHLETVLHPWNRQSHHPAVCARRCGPSGGSAHGADGSARITSRLLLRPGRRLRRDRTTVSLSSRWHRIDCGGAGTAHRRCRAQGAGHGRS